jgi:translocation and assembly module TamB
MQVGGSALYFKGLPIGNVAAKLKADGRQIIAEKLNISSGNDLVNMSGTYRIDSKAFEEVYINFLVGDIQAYLHSWLDITSPFQGDLKGTISAKGPLQAPQGQLEIASQNSQLGQFALSNTLLKASIQGRRLHIKQAKTHTPEGLIHFTGQVQADEDLMSFQSEVTDFSMRWKGHDLRLKSPARVQYSRTGTVDVSDLKLGGSFGELRLNGRLSLKRNSDFTFQVKHFSSKGWLTKIIHQNLEFHDLEAQGTVQGTLASPKIDLIGRVRSLSSEYLPNPLSGQFQFAYREDGLLIQQFNWAGEGGIFVKAKGALPILYTDKIILADNTLSLDAEAQLMELKLLNLILKKELITGGSAHLKLKMSGTWQNPIGTLNLQTKGMAFKIGQAPLPRGPSELEATLQYEGGEISLNTFRMIAPTLLVTGKGAWQHCPTPKMLCSSSKRALSGEIVFNGNAVVSDLSWLASRVPAIRRIGGSLDVEFEVQGPILKPSTAAQINLQNGELRLQMDFPTIKEIQLKATATPDEIAIKACSAQLGGETVFLQGSLSSVSSPNPFANMHIWGENLLLFRSQELRLRANTDLTLRGPFQKLSLEGKVAVTEGRFSQYIDVIGSLQGGRVPQSGNGIRLFSIRKPPFSAMILSVQITAENPFGIRNNFIRAELRPDLRLTGTGEAPILIGKVGVETARIRLPSGNLAIENGLVQFIETNPDRPVLNLIGNTRMLGYDISVIMEGPYDEPLITLTSSPPLPHEDLLMLVLTGTPPSASGRAVDKRARNLSVAVYVGRDLLDRWFRGENGSSTESILDRFEAEMGRDITQQGEETLEARFRLLEGVFQEKDTLYITGERDVYDFYNAGLRIVFRFR